MMKNMHILVAALCLGLVLPACDSGEDEAGKAALAAAEAKKKAEAESLAARKAEREAKQAAEKKAEEDKQAAVVALAVLPEKLPKKIDKACDEASAAQDELMVKYFMTTPEKKAKWDESKTTQLGMAKKTCMGTNVKIAACHANAMRNAPKELAKELGGMLRACMDKFGDKEEGGEVAAK